MMAMASVEIRVLLEAGGGGQPDAAAEDALSACLGLVETAIRFLVGE